MNIATAQLPSSARRTNQSTRSSVTANRLRIAELPAAATTISRHGPSRRTSAGISAAVRTMPSGVIAPLSPITVPEAPRSSSMRDSSG